MNERFKLTFYSTIFSLSFKALACPEGFLPPNNLQITIKEKSSGLKEEEFHSVIDKVEKVYQPVAKHWGVKLIIHRKWEDPTVNAGTYKDKYRNWVINLYGGFARHHFITPDAFALVICHEIGHHIGGAPKKSSPWEWSSVEGQADYFATLKCLRRVFRNENNSAAIRSLKVPEEVKVNCSQSFSTKWEKALCIRTSLAGLHVAKINASTIRSSLPHFKTPEENMVDSTKEEHPSPQCRLDTYFQGSVCEASSFRALSQGNEVTGTCHKQLGHQRGLRPSCWYKF